MSDTFMGRDVGLQGPPVGYNEEAFHYLLEIERKRSKYSNRPVLLMLIDFKTGPGPAPDIAGGTAAALFSMLSRCLRETDFAGWYREAQTVGAVLTQHAATNRDDLLDVVRHRIGEPLRKSLPSELRASLQVRVYELSPASRGW